jgi:hypothetical protein
MEPKNSHYLCDASANSITLYYNLHLLYDRYQWVIVPVSHNSNGKSGAGKSSAGQRGGCERDDSEMDSESGETCASEGGRDAVKHGDHEVAEGEEGGRGECGDRENKQGDIGRGDSGGVDSGGGDNGSKFNWVAQFIGLTNYLGWAHHGRKMHIDAGVAPQMLLARFALAILGKLGPFLLYYCGKNLPVEVVHKDETEQAVLTAEDVARIFKHSCRINMTGSGK